MAKKFPKYNDLPKDMTPKSVLGVNWTHEDGSTWITVKSPSKFSKTDGKVYIRILSYRGVSAGARHYYGTLRIDIPYSKCLTDPNNKKEVGKIYHISSVPIKTICQTLYRFVTKNEEDESYRDMGYRVGSVCDGFETVQELIDEFNRVCDIYFPNWKRTVDENAWAKHSKAKMLIKQGD